MAVPMQISLEEIITMLLSRVESLSLAEENNKTKFNIVLRVLYKKGLITEVDVIESVRDEHRMLKELGMIAEEPSEDIVKSIAENLIQWVKGDTEAIKQAMVDYEEKIKEYAREQEKKSPLTVASADALNQLDRLAGGQSKKGGKLII